MHRIELWLNHDPLEEEGGLNLYSYVFNNPINAVDPFGLQSNITPGGIQISLELEADELGITVAELLERKAAQKAAETMAKQLAKDGPKWQRPVDPSASAFRNTSKKLRKIPIPHHTTAKPLAEALTMIGKPLAWSHRNRPR